MSRSDKMQKPCPESAGLQLVHERNNFYRDSYKQVYLGFVVLLVVNFILAFTIFYHYTHPVQPKYFAATTDGKILKDQPLSMPLLSDNQVTQWAADSVREVFAQDFIHWKAQLQRSSALFTPYGWRYFLQKMKSSRNLDTLTQKKMVSEAQITAPPQVIREGALASGVFAWNVQLNINIVFRNVNKTIQMPFQVNLVIIRQPLSTFPDGIAINNFLPKALNPKSGNSLI